MLWYCFLCFGWCLVFVWFIIKVRKNKERFRKLEWVMKFINEFYSFKRNRKSKQQLRRYCFVKIHPNTNSRGFTPFFLLITFTCAQKFHSIFGCVYDCFSAQCLLFKVLLNLINIKTSEFRSWTKIDVRWKAGNLRPEILRATSIQ